MGNTNDFLSVSEVGKLLDVSKEVVNTWLRKGYIEYSLIGHLQKIRSEDLLEYLKNLGNSPGAMRDLEKDIKDCIREKRKAKR